MHIGRTSLFWPEIELVFISGKALGTAIPVKYNRQLAASHGAIWSVIVFSCRGSLPNEGNSKYLVELSGLSIPSMIM